MKAKKRLYFIPIIAEALESEDPNRSMEEAFDEIQKHETLMHIENERAH